MTTSTYTVPAISCDHCKHTIETALAPVPGVTSAEVDVAGKTVTVESDTEVPEAAVRAAIEEAGYELE